MSRTGKKDRPLACKHVEFLLDPKWDKVGKKFNTAIPDMRVQNAEVIDEEDSEFGLKSSERINLTAQIEAGLLTAEEIAPVMELIRKVWDNHALLTEEQV